MTSPKSRGMWGGLAALTLVVTLVGCSSDDPTEPNASGPPSPSKSYPVEPVELTLGVFAEGKELNAYRQLARAYERENQGITINVASWPNKDAMVADLIAGDDENGKGGKGDNAKKKAPTTETPDVFLTGRAALQSLVSEDQIVPVDEYLDARGVDFGDAYSRHAMESFSVDRRLQCMPYTASPTVTYYNTDLVDFESFPEKDLEPPTPDLGRWNIEQFQAALQNATKGGQADGVYVEPTLSGLAPWLVGDGGQLFDDPADPTTTALTDGSSHDALEELLPILTRPKFRLTDAELGGDTAIQRFKQGKLAVMTGDRTIVPQLRKAKNLNWDVMQMPGTQATIGDYTGLCMNAEAKNPEFAADLLAYLISDESVTRVAESGYIVPANQAVAYGDVFQSDDEDPVTATVYIDAIRTMQVMPRKAEVRALDRATRDDVRSLFGAAWDTRLTSVSEQIDATTSDILSPGRGDDPSPSPSETPTD